MGDSLRAKPVGVVRSSWCAVSGTGVNGRYLLKVS